MAGADPIWGSPRRDSPGSTLFTLPPRTLASSPSASSTSSSSTTTGGRVMRTLSVRAAAVAGAQVTTTEPLHGPVMSTQAETDSAGGGAGTGTKTSPSPTRDGQTW